MTASVEGGIDQNVDDIKSTISGLDVDDIASLLKHVDRIARNTGVPVETINEILRMELRDKIESSDDQVDMVARDSISGNMSIDRFRDCIREFMQATDTASLRRLKAILEAVGTRNEIISIIDTARSIVELQQPDPIPEATGSRSLREDPGNTKLNLASWPHRAHAVKDHQPQRPRLASG